MKVLHVISDTNIGGAGVLLTTLLQCFDRNRIQSLVALPQNSLLTERIKALEIPIHPLRYDCSRIDPRSVHELRRLAKEEHIDIVHANAALSARIAGKLEEKRVIHTRHCCFEVSGWIKRRPFSSIAGAFNRKFSDLAIATADAAADNLFQLGFLRERTEVIVNGSLPVRSVSDWELECYRRRFGILKGDFCVGICARLEHYKGHDVFLRAARQAMSLHPEIPFRFLIIGAGSRRAALEELAKREGIAPFVRFTGFVEDMAPIYRLLRINVNCSCGTETSCLALSEGMSAGVPFLATDFGGNCAMCGDSEAGMIYPCGDFEKLAELICGIACDRELERRMRAAALERYRKKYTAVAMSDALTAVYEKLMGIKDGASAMQP